MLILELDVYGEWCFQVMGTAAGSLLAMYSKRDADALKQLKQQVWPDVTEQEFCSEKKRLLLVYCARDCMYYATWTNLTL